MKVTGGDCQEMLKLLPLGANLADPGMVTGGVACYIENRENGYERTIFPRALAVINKK